MHEYYEMQPCTYKKKKRCNRAGAKSHSLASMYMDISNSDTNNTFRPTLVRRAGKGRDKKILGASLVYPT